MGVTGLLPHLKEIQEPCSLRKYKGKTLAVDTYGWLHRGLISCAQELCQDVPTRKYITYVMKKVDMLRYFGVEPYLVFDGAFLPTKAETGKERKLKRDEARKNADNMLKRGDRKSAWKEFMKAAGVTPEMAKSIMVELDSKKVKYVVAPYEADPQMVYLEKIGLVDGILSEDSDLLIFGCKKLITKLSDTAECIEINRDNFNKVKKIPYLVNYTPEQLRLVAMLSGCDYTKGVANIGLKTAFQIVKKYNSLDRVLIALRSDGKKIEPDFKDEVYKADLAFQYQKVFDPIDQRLTMLNEYPDNMDLDLEVLESCCGRTLENEIHVRICNGKIHPNTHEPLIAREQSIASLKSQSMNFGNKSTSSCSSAIRSCSYNSNPINAKPKSNSIDKFFKPASITKVLISETVNKKRESDEVKLDKNDIQVSPIDEPLDKISLKSSSTSVETSLSGKRSFAYKLDNHKKTEEKLSPTSKKVKRYHVPDGVKHNINDNFSKFFNSKTPELNLPTPERDNTKHTFDSSLLNDSDIPEEFSSPIQHDQTHSKPPDTNNVLADLDSYQEDCITDNDEIDDPGEDNSVNLTKSQVLEFDNDSEDDEIEESPVKQATTSKNSFDEFALSLREKFLMRNTSNQSDITKRILKSKNTNIISSKTSSLTNIKNSNNKTALISPLSSDDTITQNTTSIAYPKDASSNDPSYSNDKREKIKIPERKNIGTKQHINLRQFAFSRS